MLFKKSLSLDLRAFKGKTFKVLCDMVRSAIKQEHGYKSTRGLTDERLKQWSIVIRFSSKDNRASFIRSLEGLLSSDTLSMMRFRMLKPKTRNTSAIRFIRYS